AAGAGAGASSRRSAARCAPGTRRARPPAVVAGSAGSVPCSSARTRRSDSNHQGAGRGWPSPGAASGGGAGGPDGRSPRGGSGPDPVGAGEVWAGGSAGVAGPASAARSPSAAGVPVASRAATEMTRGEPPRRGLPGAGADGEAVGSWRRSESSDAAGSAGSTTGGRAPGGPTASPGATSKLGGSSGGGGSSRSSRAPAAGRGPVAPTRDLSSTGRVVTALHGASTWRAVAVAADPL